VALYECHQNIWKFRNGRVADHAVYQVFLPEDMTLSKLVGS
jgi:hypothetical protein